MMNEANVNLSGLPLLFEGFLGDLRKKGFTVGIDHRLRLHLILNRLDPDTQPNDLKLILCPIFATTPKQQTLFYQTFDAYFELLDQKTSRQDTPNQPEPAGQEAKDDDPAPPKWQYYLLGILIVVFIAVVSYQWTTPDYIKVEKKEATEERTSATEPNQGPDAGGGEKQPDNGDPQKKGEDDKIPTTGGQSTKQESNQGSDGGEEKLPTSTVAQMRREIPPEYFRQNEIYRYRWIPILFPLFVFLLVELYNFHRRQLILQRRRSKKSPYIYSLQFEAPDTSLTREHTFYHAARLLRQRVQSDVRRLDIPATISSTIERGGRLEARYRNITAPPEYLVLIDLPTHRNHHSMQWETIVQGLEHQGLHVARYFFRGDPRVCFQDPAGPKEDLDDLKQRYSGHRLIIIGEGNGLLDPVSGHLNRWTNEFHTWRRLSLLTPIPPKLWSVREIALAKDFILLPATLNGLEALKEHFDTQEKLDLRVWHQKGEHEPLPPKNWQEDDTQTLRRHLGEDVFQWLCACAVYPELHWDLTLSLGSLSCMPDGLLTEPNILKLIRLPWFKRGAIPDPIRADLVSQLNPAKSKAIREAIITILEKNPPPPKNTFAYDSYNLTIAIQKWMLNLKDRRRLKDLLKKIKTTPQNTLTQDYILLRFLESPQASPLNLIIPKRLRKLFFQKGIPQFGYKTTIRLTAALLLSLTLLLAIQPNHLLPPPHELDTLTTLNIRPYINEKGYVEANFGDGITMIYIPAGEFTMGSDRSDDEKPIHKVFLDGYWIGKTELTVGQYMKFVNETKTHYPDWGEPGNVRDSETALVGNYKQMGESLTGDHYPIVGVSWTDAVAYCDWLSKKRGVKVALPSEAQWEKAARGIDGRKYPWGNGELTGKLANTYMEDGYKYTSPVGSFPDGSSPFGALDMSGNVWEWCEDWYGFDYYKNSPYKNPIGPNSGACRVVRGGGWFRAGDGCRCAYRYRDGPSFRGNVVGFRLARSL